MKRFIVVIFALAIAMSAVVARADDHPVPEGWGPEMRNQTVTAAEQMLDHYYYIKRIASIRAALEAHRSKLIAIGGADQFADALTKVLYDASHDLHLAVWYSPPPPRDKGQKAAVDPDKFEQQIDAYDAYGYDSSARLPGNIAYLRIGGFPPLPGPKGVYDRLMAVLQNTDAMIVDMRGNNGGNALTVNYLLSYFFPKSIEVTGFLWRDRAGKFRSRRMFTPSQIGSARYVGKPVYVLVDKYTISGGEQFCYDLQSVHRATLVGDRTAGGANMGGVRPLNKYFGMFVPVGTARNPYTGSNWEGVGVRPDVAIDPSKALLEAYTLALKSANSSFGFSADARADALKDPQKALERALPPTQ